MDSNYVAHCVADSVFYALRREPVEVNYFATPSGGSAWLRERNADWETWAPPEAQLRVQGWKIHVSATVGNAQRVLEVVSKICVTTRTTFKFVPSIERLMQRNAKNADRSGSGKFITIYPHDDEQLQILAHEIEAELGGIENPYILSDLRWRQGPVHFRYGGFVLLRSFDALDRPVASILSEDGVLSADERSPMLKVPDFAATPDIVRSALVEREQSNAESELACFENIVPLHFTNAGGVYRARRIGSDSDSILKEARPHAGIDFRSRDSTSRLRTEHEVLLSVSDSESFPAVKSYFTAWEHEFLEMEFLSGIALSSWVASNYPFGPRINGIERDLYVSAVTKIAKSLAEAIGTLHSKNVVMGDLHPGNILVQGDFSVKLIDLEDGRSLESLTPSGLNVLSYKPIEGLTPEAGDWYSASRVIASMFMVQRPIEILAPSFWDFTIEWTRRVFGFEAAETILALADRAGSVCTERKVLSPKENLCVASKLFVEADEESLLRVACFEVAAGISEARHAIDGLLFPGDIAQWETPGGSVNAATGAAGVLLALGRAGTAIEREDQEWLRTTSSALMSSMQPGLYNGTAGLATALFESGYRDLASEALKTSYRQVFRIRRCDLFGGIAGIGLAVLGNFYATRHDESLEMAVQIAEVLCKRLDDSGSGALLAELDRRSGLFYGWSGLALFFASVAPFAPRTDEYNDLSRTLLERDLNRVSESGAGVLGIEDIEGQRSLPYLATGSAGVLFALAHVPAAEGLGHNAGQAYVEGFMRACNSQIYAYSGLFNGRAGIVAGLAGATGLHDAISAQAAVQVRMLGDHALRWRGSVQFPGENYLRLSADLSTGSAGVLAAITSLRDGVPHWLPILNSQETLRTVQRF